MHCALCIISMRNSSVTEGESETGQENITQIMWPSSYLPEVRNGPLYQKLGKLAKSVLGEDMAFDFDMIISKVPNPVILCVT